MGSTLINPDVMNIFYTFAAVALQAVAIPAFWRDYHLYQVLCVRTAAVMVCGLYCFELVFRFDMRLPLYVGSHDRETFCGPSSTDDQGLPPLLHHLCGMLLRHSL